MTSYTSSIFQRGMDKLCWHRKLKDNNPLRTVHNNVTLEPSADLHLPVQTYYKTNEIKVKFYLQIYFRFS